MSITPLGRNTSMHKWRLSLSINDLMDPQYVAIFHATYIDTNWASVQLHTRTV